jgi:hypothetical protein
MVNIKASQAKEGLERSLDEGIGSGLIGVMTTASQKRTGMICMGHVAGM